MSHNRRHPQQITLRLVSCADLMILRIQSAGSWNWTEFGSRHTGTDVEELEALVIDSRIQYHLHPSSSMSLRTSEM